MVELKRMWINQPSRHQPLHRLHGTNVLAHMEDDDAYRIYFLSGPAISAVAPRLSLSDGWIQSVEGEEIMVNTPYDVFTLPLQPSGLSSGPRFVVHVPRLEQPADVDRSDAQASKIEALLEERDALRDALREAQTRIAAIGYPAGPDGKYNKNGEWTFSDAVPRAVDAKEVEAAFLIIRTALAQLQGGE